MISSILIMKSYGDIYNDKNEIEEQIVHHLRQEIEGWGLEIRKVHLHDLIQTRNIRLHGLSQTQVPENL